MGLETGWNCAISCELLASRLSTSSFALYIFCAAVMPRKARIGRSGPSTGGGAVTTATKVTISEEKAGGLGQFGLDDDEEDCT